MGSPTAEEGGGRRQDGDKEEEREEEEEEEEAEDGLTPPFPNFPSLPFPSILFYSISPIKIILSPTPNTQQQTPKFDVGIHISVCVLFGYEFKKLKKANQN